MDSLPLTEGILEQDYQELIRELDRRYRELEARDSQKYRDMIEYYTLWAHQIKTPIASMHLNLENEDTTLARDIRSDLMRIEQYADMVLCYLRLDSEDTDYVFREYATDSIVKQALHKFSSFFIRGKIRLEYRPIKGCVLTDEKWILLFLGAGIVQCPEVYQSRREHLYRRNRTRRFHVSGIRELVLRRRICPGFLKRGIQAVTEGCKKKPAESDCIYANASVNVSDIKSGQNPVLGKELPCIWI